MYKTKVLFTDLQDGSHKYLPGDIFPREGLEVSEDRLKELSTTANRRGIVLIEEVKEDAETEPFTEDMNPPVKSEEVEEKENVTEDKPKATKRKKKADE